MTLTLTPFHLIIGGTAACILVGLAVVAGLNAENPNRPKSFGTWLWIISVVVILGSLGAFWARATGVWA